MAQQTPPGTSLSSFICECFYEQGRDLDYRLPDGTLISVDVDELRAILDSLDALAGLYLSGRIAARGRAATKGHAKAVGKELHRPGPAPSKRDEIRAQMETGIAERQYTLKQLL